MNYAPLMYLYCYLFAHFLDSPQKILSQEICDQRPNKYAKSEQANNLPDISSFDCEQHSREHSVVS